ELPGLVVHDLIHHTRPDGTPYPAADCPIYASIRDGSVKRVDDELFWRKDGVSMPVEYVSAPLRGNNGTTGAVVIFQDVTARRQAAESLRRSEELFSKVFHASPAAICITRQPDGRFL